MSSADTRLPREITQEWLPLARRVTDAVLTLTGLDRLWGRGHGVATASTDNSLEQECYADFHDENRGAPSMAITMGFSMPPSSSVN